MIFSLSIYGATDSAEKAGEGWERSSWGEVLNNSKIVMP